MEKPNTFLHFSTSFLLVTSQNFIANINESMFQNFWIKSQKGSLHKYSYLIQNSFMLCSWLKKFFKCYLLSEVQIWMISWMNLFELFLNKSMRVRGIETPLSKNYFFVRTTVRKKLVNKWVPRTKNNLIF
jgi:hypothetical protein